MPAAESWLVCGCRTVSRGWALWEGTAPSRCWIPSWLVGEAFTSRRCGSSGIEQGASRGNLWDCRRAPQPWRAGRPPGREPRLLVSCLPLSLPTRAHPENPVELGSGLARDAGARSPGGRCGQKHVWRPGSPHGAGCTRHAHPCHRDLGASPCTLGFSSGRVRCMSGGGGVGREETGRNGGRGGWREPLRGGGSCVLGRCVCPVAPLAPVRPRSLARCGHAHS